MAEKMHRCGFIAVIGRPNVGKSTLINKIVGEKVSIVSSRPQTTRHRILGILTRPQEQLIFVDTPGLHKTKGKALNRIINQTTRRSALEVDLLLFVIESRGWQRDDEPVLELAKQSNLPAILVINKVDQLKQKNQLLPLIESVANKHEFAGVIPVSAKTGDNVERLLEIISPLLPLASAGFEEAQYTDRGVRFQAAELVREQIFRGFGQELPYATAVEVTDFVREANIDKISVNIWVDHDSQKGMMIGKGGEKLREIGTLARQQMERLFHRKIFLDLRVKVRTDWANDQIFLQQIGYNEEI